MSRAKLTPDSRFDPPLLPGTLRAYTVPCPGCKAEVNEQCLTPNGHVRGWRTPCQARRIAAGKAS